jgi:phage-related protein
VKPVVWVGDSLERLRGFPTRARRDAGFQLENLQAGLLPADWKPMASVGPGVSEIRVNAGGAFRVLYIAKFSEAIYVLHAFQKKSRKTAPIHIDLARTRLRAVMEARRQI